MIYLDHAATSWPKPPGVLRAMARFLEAEGGNPGRAGHRLSLAAARAVHGAREAVAALVNAPDPLGVVFTANATHALNLALHGCLGPGSRVVAGGMEHNAVMRPLRRLEALGAGIRTVPAGPGGELDPGAFGAALAGGADLVVVNHASNVCGTLAPVAEIARAARAAGALVLVDAAQTLGALPVDMEALGIDLLAFTGHKGLHGPQGTGGLVLGRRVDPLRLEPLLQGGTGSASEREVQPEFLPDRFESGTPNGPGIAGLAAGLAWVAERGPAELHARAVEQARFLAGGLREIPGVTVHGPSDPAQALAVISFTVHGREVSELGFLLDDAHDVLCRVGLHCAPAAHRALGTFPSGTVRFAPGPLATRAELEAALRAVAAVVRP